MSTKQIPVIPEEQLYPRKVIRVGKLRDYWGYSHNQQAEIIKQLVERGWIDPPFNPVGLDGQARCLWADQVARVQQIGLKNALNARKKGEAA